MGTSCSSTAALAGSASSPLRARAPSSKVEGGGGGVSCSAGVAAAVSAASAAVVTAAAGSPCEVLSLQPGEVEVEGIGSGRFLGGVLFFRPVSAAPATGAKRKHVQVTAVSQEKERQKCRIPELPSNPAPPVPPPRLPPPRRDEGESPWTVAETCGGASDTGRANEHFSPSAVSRSTVATATGGSPPSPQKRTSLSSLAVNLEEACAPAWERCLVDVSGEADLPSCVPRDRPILLVDLDGVLMSCFPRCNGSEQDAKELPSGVFPLKVGRGKEELLLPRPGAIDFLMRMRFEAGLAVAACTACAKEDAVAKVEALEAQVPEFHFDFIAHAGTVAAWEQPEEEGGNRGLRSRRATRLHRALSTHHGLQTFPLEKGREEEDDLGRRDNAFQRLELDCESLRSWLLTVLDCRIHMAFWRRLTSQAEQDQEEEEMEEVEAKGSFESPSKTALQTPTPSRSSSRMSSLGRILSVGSTASSVKKVVSRLSGRSSQKKSKNAFDGKWTCTETWGMDEFLKGCKASYVQRCAASKAPWPTWEFRQNGNNITFINHTMVGELREDYEVDGPQYVAIDGKKQRLECRASWEGEVLIIERSGPQGRFREQRSIDAEGNLRFVLSAPELVGSSWGRTFCRKR